MNSYRLLGEYVAAGLGIAHPPAMVAAQLLEGRVITRILEEFVRPAEPLYAVYPSARFPSPKVRAFIELLEQHFAKPPWDRRTAAE